MVPWRNSERSCLHHELLDISNTVHGYLQRRVCAELLCKKKYFNYGISGVQHLFSRSQAVTIGSYISPCLCVTQHQSDVGCSPSWSLIEESCLARSSLWSVWCTTSQLSWCMTHSCIITARCWFGLARRPSERQRMDVGVASPSPGALRGRGSSRDRCRCRQRA